MTVKNPKWMNPFEQMAYLDGKGESYHLSNIYLIDGTMLPGADVYNHSREWLEVLVMGETGRRWLNTANVISFELVE